MSNRLLKRKETEKLMKRYYPFLLAFLIPVIIMTAAIIYKGIYPFGDRCFLRVDMYNQYMPFFTELHRKIREGGSLFFSWHAGLGSNFVALYAYYLASPVNWLLIFCPEPFIIEFMTMLIVMKIGLCGLTFSIYLNRHFHRRDISITVFSVFYALSGFMAAYNWNIMWLDCIFLAPLIILGLEELVEKKKPMLYCITLGLSIITNYYISILICSFLIFYFLILILPQKLSEKGRSIVRFAIFSLLAGGLAGFMLLPGTIPLQATRFNNLNFPKSITFYFNALDMIARHCVNVSTEIRNDHWPNIYCGAAVFFLLPLYVCCRKISWKEKVPRILMLAFFLVSFSVNLLNFIWHGMNYPDSLPARQSFLYIFMLLVLCYEAFLHLQEYSRIQLAGATGGAILFVYLCSRFVKNNDFSAECFVLTILYIFIYALLLYWYREKTLPAKLAVILLSFLVLTEAGMNTIQTSVATTSRTKYTEDFRTNQALLASIKEKDVDFLRIEEFERMTKNDGMLAGFPTATLFSSTTNEAVASFYKHLGMSTSKVFYSYDGATPLSSALLSVDYTFSDNLVTNDTFHKLIEKKKGDYLYQNQYALPLGYVVPKDLEDKWNLQTGNPVMVQNSLGEALGVEEPLYRKLDVECMDDKAEITVDEGGCVFAYVTQSRKKNVTATIEGNEKTFEKVNYSHILDMGRCNGNTTIKVEESGNKRDVENDLKMSAYLLNEKSLAQIIDKLGKETLKVEHFTDTSLTGTVTLKQEGVLATSIPAEPGWKAYVDGKETPIQLFGKAMIGLPLTAGEHEIRLQFTPPGLYAGILLSTVSIVILILVERNRKKKQVR